eukprot:m51a1_g14381 hypothetical protein (68) ;mRNA; r:290676-290879
MQHRGLWTTRLTRGPATAATRAKGSSIANLLMLSGKSIELHTVYGEAHKSFSGLATPRPPRGPQRLG